MPDRQVQGHGAAHAEAEDVRLRHAQTGAYPLRGAVGMAGTGPLWSGTEVSFGATLGTIAV